MITSRLARGGALLDNLVLLLPAETACWAGVLVLHCNKRRPIRKGPRKPENTSQSQPFWAYPTWNFTREIQKLMEMFFRLYEGLDREGPGSLAMTQRAYDLCEGLPDKPIILELGCGSGGATMALATITEGTIVATDVHQPFLDRLMERAKQKGVADRVTAMKMDMADLDFAPRAFDLIWCEGAAYIIGVDKALKYWMDFLRPGGCLVLSDAVWLSVEARERAPEDLRAFWAEEYPSMRLPEDNTKAAEAMGYASLGYFTIETSCWDAFYLDVERRMNEIGPLFGDDPEGKAIIDITRKEIELYRACPGRYGYEFHVFRK